MDIFSRNYDDEFVFLVVFVTAVIALSFLFVKINYINDQIIELSQNVTSIFFKPLIDTKIEINDEVEKQNKTHIDVVFDKTSDSLTLHALKVINRERMIHGLDNVTLSPINCGQIHAENLLKYKCLSHWDTEGLKPYMRYTLSGGTGAVSENCAWMTSSSLVNPYEAIEKLNWGMIYDDADSNWGHRNNTLNPKHNRVSIGISYDQHNVFLVQDFENYYGILYEFNLEGSKCSLIYDAFINWSPNQIIVFYDPIPQNITIRDLSHPPYNNEYDGGELVGAILPKEWKIKDGITVNAENWIVNNSSFRASFDMIYMFDQYGEGVYTFSIRDSQCVYTTYSIFLEDNR